MFAQAHSTLFHSPGSQLFLRLCLLQEPRAGVEKCCSLWTRPVAAAWPLVLPGASSSQGLGRSCTAALSKCPAAETVETNSTHARLSKSHLPLVSGDVPLYGIQYVLLLCAVSHGHSTPYQFLENKSQQGRMHFSGLSSWGGAPAWIPFSDPSVTPFTDLT